MALLFSAAAFAGCGGEDTNALITKLQRQLPLGTPAEQVEKILTQYNVQHSFYPQENAFRGIIRKTRKSGFLVRESVTVTILLDDNRNAKNVEIKRVLTGL